MNLLRSAALAAFVSLLPNLRAQVQVYGGPDPDRKASTVILFGESMMAGAAINYSAPVWKDEYNAMIDRLKGKNLRLGKNWWTSFDSSVPVEIAGVRFEPGSYYLGMACDKDGKFSLLVFEAAAAMKGGLMPFAAEAWKGGVSVPLELHKDALKEPAVSMAIALEADKQDPSKGSLRIHWGNHELFAAVKFVLPNAKAPAKKG